MTETKEILKYGDRSVVAYIVDGKITKYVACTYYDPTKNVGEQWSWGHYYDIWGEVTEEEALRSAAYDLYKINEEDNKSIKSKADKYDRMLDIAKDVIDTYLTVNGDDGVVEDAVNHLKNDIKITKEEAIALGITDILYPKKYNIMEVTMVRQQTVTVNIVVPANVEVNRYNADDYIEDDYNLEPENDGDWEVDYVDTYREGLSKKDIENNYSYEDIWNYEDLDDM